MPGKAVENRLQSRSGGGAQRRGRAPGAEDQPSPQDWGSIPARLPALKRRAIVGRPSGTKPAKTCRTDHEPRRYPSLAGRRCPVAVGMKPVTLRR